MLTVGARLATPFTALACVVPPSTAPAGPLWMLKATFGLHHVTTVFSQA